MGNKKLYRIFTAAAALVIAAAVSAERAALAVPLETEMVRTLSEAVSQRPISAAQPETDENSIEETQLYALAAVLMDADTGRVLYGKNEDEQLAMASTTKIMTCIIALEYGDLDALCTVSSYAASMPAVKLGLKSGEQYKLEDLLYAMMLESDNDAAVVVAEGVAGSVEAFAALMNEKARELGADNTCFVTPNGLDAEGHCSTARDMALIASYAIQNEDFLKITNTAAYAFTDTEGKRSFSVYNHDAFLTQMDGAIGVKTGYTGQAGYCFVGAVEQGDKTLVSVVLGSGWPPNKSYKWTDTKLLMNYGLENYSMQTVFVPVAHFAEIPVEDGINGSVNTYINGSYALLLSEYDEVTVEYSYTQKLTAPVYANTRIGEARIIVNGICMCSFPIMTYDGDEVRDYEWCFRQTLEAFLRPPVELLWEEGGA